jgi:hypothetical protein
MSGQRDFVKIEGHPKFDIIIYNHIEFKLLRKEPDDISQVGIFERSFRNNGMGD